MDGSAASPEAGGDENALLIAAIDGDPRAFDHLAGHYRQELYVHCYRMLGSVQDAEDALQEALLAAWRGIAGFDGHSSLRTWLYRVTTNACLRLNARRPRRMLTPDHFPPRHDPGDLGEPVTGPLWLEPLLDRELPGQHLRREAVELAFVAALQHLPGTQRAVLVLRDVLALPAAEVAGTLDITTTAVHSSLQRARRTVRQRAPGTTQQDEMHALGDAGLRSLLDAFTTAWEHADPDTLLDHLAGDVRFTMPPLPAWFDGRDDVGTFLVEHVFATRWQLVPLWANGQPGFACYQIEPDSESSRLGALSILTLRSGQIAGITGFLDPDLHRRLDLPAEPP